MRGGERRAAALTVGPCSGFQTLREGSALASPGNLSPSRPSNVRTEVRVPTPHGHTHRTPHTHCKHTPYIDTNILHTTHTLHTHTPHTHTAHTPYTHTPHSHKHTTPPTQIKQHTTHTTTHMHNIHTHHTHRPRSHKHATHTYTTQTQIHHTPHTPYTHAPHTYHTDNMHTHTPHSIQTHTAHTYTTQTRATYTPHTIQKHTHTTHTICTHTPHTYYTTHMHHSHTHPTHMYHTDTNIPQTHTRARAPNGERQRLHGGRGLGEQKSQYLQDWNQEPRPQALPQVGQTAHRLRSTRPGLRPSLQRVPRHPSVLPGLPFPNISKELGKPPPLLASPPSFDPVTGTREK